MIRINTTFKELCEFGAGTGALILLGIMFLVPRGDVPVDDSPSTEPKIEHSAPMERIVPTTPSVPGSSSLPNLKDPARTAQDELQRVWVVTVHEDDVLNVRTGPNWQESLVCTLDPEATVSVLEKLNSGWWSISTADACSGWVNSHYLREEFRE